MNIVINTVNFYNISGNIINVSNVKNSGNPAERTEHQGTEPDQLVLNTAIVSDEHPLVKQLEERVMQSEKECAAMRDRLRQLDQADADE